MFHSFSGTESSAPFSVTTLATVGVKITDSLGDTTTAAATVDGKLGPVAPNADPGGVYRITLGDGLTVDGSGSFNTDR